MNRSTAILWRSTLARTALTLTLLFAPSYVFAAAGLLVVAQDGGDTYVLLARDSRRSYFEMLAGGSERAQSLTDNSLRQESNYETALREAVEETRGYLGRRELLAASSLSDYVDDNGFVFYRAQVQKFELDAIRTIRVPDGEKWIPMREIAEYVWVDVNEILNSTDDNVLDSKGRNITVHPGLRSGLRKANAKGWF